MKKLIIHILAAFIPNKVKRKAFRRKYLFRWVHDCTNEDIRDMTNNLCRKLTLIKNDDIWTLPNGIKFFCPLYPWDLIQDIIVNSHNFYEHDTLIKLREYIPKNAVILDIGANIGNHSVFWAAEGAEKIHSFEPIKQTFGILCKNIEINGFNKIITPHNIGLGDKSSGGEIMRSLAVNIGGTQIRSIEESNQYSLRIDRLDDMDLSLDKIDFIKIDVENFELKTLAGMKKTLEKYKPIVFIESYEFGGNYPILKNFESNAPKVKEFFKALGYAAPVRFEPFDWLFVYAADKDE
jgi:FkbM family methyltransferase